MNATVKALLPYALVALAGGGWLATDRMRQRQIGARDVLLASSRQRGDSIQRRADSLAKRIRVDTVKLTKRFAVTDTALTARLRGTLDSLKALGVPKPETVTVKVPVSVLAAADTTLRECRSVLSTCTLALHAEQESHAETRKQLKLTQQGQPSWWQRWGMRVVEDVAAFQVGRISAGKFP